MTDDRTIIADVLEHDRRATRILTVTPGRRALDLQNERLAMALAAPKLARRLTALLDALDDEYQAYDEHGSACRVIKNIRAAYARNLAERSKP